MRTVYNIKKTIYMGNGIQRKPASGGINKKRSRDFIDALKTKIAKDPTISIYKIADELKMDPRLSERRCMTTLALNHIPGRWSV